MGQRIAARLQEPAARIATVAAAGAEQVPFTTGLLIGIGETRAERLETLFAIRDLHAAHGHVQVRLYVDLSHACKSHDQTLAYTPHPDYDPADLLVWNMFRVCSALPLSTRTLGTCAIFHIHAPCMLPFTTAKAVPCEAALPGTRDHRVLQEVIVQNFRAKKGTLMADAPEPSLSELLWTVAMARLILGPAMSIQVHLTALFSALPQE